MMSVQVEITIADCAARRHLSIERIGTDERTDVHEYTVISTGGSGTFHAQFQHFYEDDQYVLIRRAIEALHLKYDRRARRGNPL